METLFIGKNTIFLPEIGSTNSYATDLLKNVNLAEGTVVHTANQTQGRGQRGNTWNAEPASNLTASIILKPGFLNIKKQFFLYQVAALACYDTLAELLKTSHFDIKIKWPNDLLVNRHKISGILIENNILNNSISSCIIGIGVNVNQKNFDGNIKATSLKLLTGEDFKIDTILKLLCSYLEKYYLALKNNKHDWITEIYLSHFFGLDQWLNFDIRGTIASLLVKGMSDNGLLLLEDRSGYTREVDVQGLKWIY